LTHTSAVIKRNRFAQNSNITYCHPEIGSVGLTEAKAREKGYNVKIGKFLGFVGVSVPLW